MFALYGRQQLGQSDAEAKAFFFFLCHSIARKHQNVDGVGRVKCYCAVNYVCAIYIPILTMMIALTAITFIANHKKRLGAENEANIRETEREREKDSDRYQQRKCLRMK